MAARQAALEKLRLLILKITTNYILYRFADHRAPINQPPMEIIDCTVSPPAVTSYPEYPVSEYSTKPAFNVHVERAAPRPSLQPQHVRAAGDFGTRRAKAIVQMHFEAFK